MNELIGLCQRVLVLSMNCCMFKFLHTLCLFVSFFGVRVCALIWGAMATMGFCTNFKAVTPSGLSSMHHDFSLHRGFAISCNNTLDIVSLINCTLCCTYKLIVSFNYYFSFFFVLFLGV